MQRAGLTVTGRARDLLVETWESQANLALFLALLVGCVFVLPSIGFGKHDEQLYRDVSYSVLVISGVAIAWGRRRLFYSAAALGCIALIVRWLAWGKPGIGFELWREELTLATVLTIAAIVLVQVFGRGPVTVVRIQGAIAAYLLFGFGWAHAYVIAAHFNPSAFSSSVGTLSSPSDWMYYSFVTLTTLGYGDIVPTGPVSRSLAIGEALSGQLYLAVMVARLVAMQVVSWQENVFHDS
jgi:hypothetical protein